MQRREIDAEIESPSCARIVSSRIESLLYIIYILYMMGLNLLVCSFARNSSLCQRKFSLISCLGRGSALNAVHIADCALANKIWVHLGGTKIQPQRKCYGNGARLHSELPPTAQQMQKKEKLYSTTKCAYRVGFVWCTHRTHIRVQYSLKFIKRWQNAHGSHERSQPTTIQFFS